jgi:transcriptional regulator with XRE-family HTH domain
MKSDRAPPKTLPRPVADVLPQIGAAIRTARIRRRKTAADLAQRLNVSLPTLRKLEAGDGGVSLGTFVTALWLLDLLKDFRTALDPANDRLGITLDLARISKRVRRTKDLDLGEL